MVARGGKGGIAVSGERERFPITKMRGGSGFFFKVRSGRGGSGTYQGGADGIHDRHAGVDVGDELALTLARVRALAQEHDLGLLREVGGGRAGGEASVRSRFRK